MRNPIRQMIKASMAMLCVTAVMSPMSPVYADDLLLRHSPYLGAGVGWYQADYSESASNVSATLGGRDHKLQGHLFFGYQVALARFALAAELAWSNGYGELDDYRIGASIASRSITNARSLSLLPSYLLDDQSQVYARIGRGTATFEISTNGGTHKSDDLSTQVYGIGYQRQIADQLAWRVEYQHITADNNHSLFPGVAFQFASSGLVTDLSYRF